MTSRVLITRPRGEAERTGEDVRVCGFDPVIEPLLSVMPLPFTISGDRSGLVFTSANAVRAAAVAIKERGTPVFCVGAHTAETARACGWKNVQAAAGSSGDALNALLATQDFSPGSRILHLAGEIVATPIEIPGLSVERICVYRTIPATSFSAPARDALMRREIDAALFFSARTASVFADLAAKEGCTPFLSSIKALCLSDSVVKSLEHLRWHSIRIAENSDHASLLALLRSSEHP